MSEMRGAAAATGAMGPAGRRAASGTRAANAGMATMNRHARTGAGLLRRVAGAALATGAAYLSITKAKDAITTTTDLAHSTLRLHRNLGLTIKTASEWSAVAKARGIDNNSLGMSFTKLSTAQQQAVSGGKKQVEMFKQLGVSQNDLKKGSGDFSFLLNKVAAGFGKARGGAQRQALALGLLGRGWKSILPLFSQGEKSMNAQLALANKYGATFGGKSLKSMEDLIKAERELKFAQLGLQIQFTTQIAPGLMKIALAGARVAQVFGDKRLTDTQRWDKISKILGPVASMLQRTFEAAIPKIADAVGQAAPRIALAFVSGFLNAGILGKLAIGAWLLHRFGGPGAFSSLGRRMGLPFGQGMAESAASQGATGGQKFGSRFGSGARGMMAQVGPMLAIALWSAIAPELNKRIQDFAKKNPQAKPAAKYANTVLSSPFPVIAAVTHPKQAFDAIKSGAKTAASALGLIGTSSKKNDVAFTRLRTAALNIPHYFSPATLAAAKHDSTVQRLAGRVNTLRGRLSNANLTSKEYITTDRQLRIASGELNTAIGHGVGVAGKAANAVNNLRGKLENCKDAARGAAGAAGGWKKALGDVPSKSSAASSASGSVASAIRGARDAFNGASSAAQAYLDKLSKVKSAGGGKGATPFAAGGTVRKMGPILVGESGPELMWGMPGMHIQPLPRARVPQTAPAGVGDSQASGIEFDPKALTPDLHLYIDGREIAMTVRRHGSNAKARR